MPVAFSSTNRTKLYKYTNWCSREEKRAFRDRSGVQRREQSKNSKVLKASNLRAFYKLYIISNQWFIITIVELMCCYGRLCTFLWFLL